MTEKEN